MSIEKWHELVQADHNDPIGNRLAHVIAEYSSLGWALIDKRGYCIYANRALLDLTGYTEDELRRAPLHELIHHHYPNGSLFPKEDCCVHYAFVQNNSCFADQEAVYFRKDGTTFQAACSGKTVSVNGKPEYMVMEVRDITLSKRKEDAHRQKELTFKLAIKAGKIGTWERDLNSNTVLISPSLAQLLGLPLDHLSLTAEEWRALIVPEDLPKFEEACQKVFQQDYPIDMEYRLQRKDSSIIWVLSRGAIFKDAQGTPIRALGITIDITRTKETEKALRASEERFRLLTELSPDGILVTCDEHYVYANESAARILGARTQQDIIGRSPFDFIPEPFHEIAKERMEQVLRHDQIAPPLDLPYRRLDGKEICAQCTLGKVAWEDRPAIQVLLRDVTELKRAREKLQVMNERLKIAVEGTGEGIWDWEVGENSFQLSGGLKKILGYQEDEEIEDKIKWGELTHPEDLSRVHASIKACLTGKTPVYQCEYRIKARDGSWKWVLSRGVIVARNKNQKPSAMTGTLIDITSKKESDDLAWRHANLDALTGLASRRLFIERLATEISKTERTHYQIALLFIDLDGFKQVNDAFGHDAGDMLLIDASHRISNTIRKTDMVARLGGDEFTVLLTELDNTNHIDFICQKILSALSQPFHTKTETAYISCSIGIALYPLDATTPEDLLRKADQAMYAAKRSGKNQFSYFTPSMDEKAHLRLRITNELRRALQEHQFSVHYQPVVDLATGQIVKAEALLRWKNPAFGNVEPSVFIPLAEESGLIGQIGNWVFKEAAADAKRWSSHLGKTFQISVNKSPVQFITRDSEFNWLQHLAELGMSGNSISIEITEGVLLDSSPNITNQLLAYRDAGIQVAIDDFGTGYSSMSYLRKFSIDYLKIDQSFVQRIADDLDNRTIAETIIVMAHKLGLKVIAEGIETQEQMEWLTSAGCDYGQGFLFSRAVPSDQFENLLYSPSVMQPSQLSLI